MNKHEVFASVIEKYKDIQDSHLDNMSIDELCEYRQTISKQLKSLEEERKLIDETIMESFSDAELKHGITLRSGSCLKMRSRTSWKYPEEVAMEVSELRRYSRESGDAYAETSIYLVLV